MCFSNVYLLSNTFQRDCKNNSMQRETVWTFFAACRPDQLAGGLEILVRAARRSIGSLKRRELRAPRRQFQTMFSFAVLRRLFHRVSSVFLPRYFCFTISAGYLMRLQKQHMLALPVPREPRERKYSVFRAKSGAARTTTTTTKTTTPPPPPPRGGDLRSNKTLSRPRPTLPFPPLQLRSRSSFPRDVFLIGKSYRGL